MPGEDLAERTVPSSPRVVPAQRSGVKKMFSILRLIAVNFLVFAVAAELASLILVHLRKWPSARPTYHLTYYKFWTDTNRDFGIWHRPNGHFLHQEGCFSLELTTNSYGARDVERSRHSGGPAPSSWAIRLWRALVSPTGSGLPTFSRLAPVASI